MATSAQSPLSKEELVAKLKEGGNAWNEWRKSVGRTQKIDLTGVNLSFAKLEETDLSNAKLDKARLNNADLSKCNLAGSELRDADFSRAKLLGANLSGSDLSGAHFNNANLKRADLSRANLSQCHLDDAKLRAAKLFRANLSRCILTHARLERSDLNGADLRDADLSYANLVGAQIGKGTLLRDANLTGTNLYKADFAGANLQSVKFKGAKVLQANLREALLRGADLSTTEAGLLPHQLAGADLTGAKLPETFVKLYEKLGSVSEISDSAKKLFLALLAACLYSWLTIGTTKDVDLITNRASSPLPIIQTVIPIVGFYVVAPIILVCIYFYFHFYLQKLWQELAKFPAIFPDGTNLDERADPWLFNDLVRAHFTRLRENRPFLSHFQQWISVLLAWWFVPITLVLFWLRYLPRHDSKFAIFLGVILGVSITSAIRLYRLAKGSLKGSEPTTFALRKALRRPKSYIDASLALVPIAVILTLSLLIFHAPSRWSYHRFNAYLQDADVSIKPPNWTGKKDEELDLVKGANLVDMDLRNAFASFSFLAKSNLAGSHLEAADLTASDLRNTTLLATHLDNAHLQQAHLQHTFAKGIFLPKAKLTQADLRDANLSFADLRGADLGDSNLEAADLSYADLTGANLFQSPEPQPATPNAFGGFGRGSTGGYNDGPEIRFANLVNTKGLTADQIMRFKDWDLAFYDARMREQLQLPENHNDIVDLYKKSGTREPFQSWKAQLLQQAFTEYSKSRSKMPFATWEFEWLERKREAAAKSQSN